MRSVNDSMIRSKVPIAFIGAGLNISKKTPKETRIMRYASNPVKSVFYLENNKISFSFEIRLKNNFLFEIIITDVLNFINSYFYPNFHFPPGSI